MQVSNRPVAQRHMSNGSPLPDPHQQRDMFRQMVLIRCFEERAVELRVAGRIHGVLHPYIGQEAVAVGVCANLRLDDRLVSTHRGHGHCIAKGADIRRMMAELFGRRDGYCKGKGGSMHIAAFDVGMLGANGIVAAGLPIAAGAALAAQILALDTVAVGFFGDGATGEGAFHEALNLAALWKLPAIFVCENNQYASETPVEQAVAVPDIAEFAHAYSMPGFVVDGNDVLEVYATMAAAVSRARAGDGPALVECKTFRRSAHALRQSLPAERRSRDILATWEARDPIALFERSLRDRGILSEADCRAIREDVALELDAAVAFAESSPYPDPEDALADVFADMPEAS